MQSLRVQAIRDVIAAARDAPGHMVCERATHAGDGGCGRCDSCDVERSLIDALERYQVECPAPSRTPSTVQRVIDIARECTFCIHGEEVRPCDCTGHRMKAALSEHDARDVASYEALIEELDVAREVVEAVERYVEQEPLGTTRLSTGTLHEALDAYDRVRFGS